MGPAYRIVREAEFVEPSIGIWYYTRLAEGYTKGLAQAMESKQIRQWTQKCLLTSSWESHTLLALSGLFWMNAKKLTIIQFNGSRAGNAWPFWYGKEGNE